MKGWGRIGGALFATVMALALPASGAAAGWVTLPGAPSAATGNASPASVAVDPSGNLWLAFADDPTVDHGTTVHVYERPPGGSFTSVASFPATATFPPMIAAGSDGTIAVAWDDTTSGISGAPRLALRHPGGTFGTPHAATTGAESVLVGLAVAPDGTGVMAWEDDTAPNIHVESMSPAGAVTDQSLSGIASIPDLFKFAANANGQMTIAWADNPSATKARVAYSDRQSDGTFAPAQTLTERTRGAGETSQSDSVETLVLDPAGDLMAVDQLAVVSASSTALSLRTHIRAVGSATFADGTLASKTVSGDLYTRYSPAATFDAARTAVVTWSDPSNAIFSATAPAAGGYVFGGGAAFGGLTAQSCMDDSSTTQLVPLSGGGIAGMFVDLGGFSPCDPGPLIPLSPAGGDAVSAQPALTPAGTDTASSDSSPLVADAAGDAFAAIVHHPEVAPVTVVAYDGSPPVLGAIAQPAHIEPGKSASLSVTAADALSGVSSVSWDFGDGSTGSGLAVSHVWARPGTYAVKATATDGVGNSASSALTITVKDVTPPVISHVSVKHRVAHFTLSENATVKLVVTRKHHRPRTLTRRGLNAGKHAVTLAPRHGKHALTAGHYTLTITATDPAHNKSRATVVKFKVRAS